MTRQQVEQREKAYSRSLGRCFVCGKPLIEGYLQYSHRLGQTQTNYKRFGTFFIDNTWNGEFCCSNQCNATVDVGKSIGAELRTLAYILIKETRERMGIRGLGEIADMLTKEIKDCGGME